MRTKFRFEHANLTVEVSGSEKFVQTSLRDIVTDLSRIAQDSSVPVAERTVPAITDGRVARTEVEETLALYLSRPELKGKLNTQKMQFLAAAAYLQVAHSFESLATSQVQEALRKSRYNGLGNPSDSLNKNIMSGYCDRDKSGFYVTEAGLQAVGMNS